MTHAQQLKEPCGDTRTTVKRALRWHTHNSSDSLAVTHAQQFRQPCSDTRTTVQTALQWLVHNNRNDLAVTHAKQTLSSTLSFPQKALSGWYFVSSLQFYCEMTPWNKSGITSVGLDIPVNTASQSSMQNECISWETSQGILTPFGAKLW